MRKCGTCHVTVHPQHENCPLCGRRLAAPDASGSIVSDRNGGTVYPAYSFDAEDARFSVKKLVLFLVIVVSAVSVFINIMTLDKAPVFWSAAVAASLAFLWCFMALVWAKTMGIGRKLIYIYGLIAVYLIVIDVFAGFTQWSTTYVLPFLTIAVVIVLTCIALSSNAKFNEYMGALLSIFFISLCPILIFLLSLSALAWTSFAAALYCLLTAIGLFIFKGRRFRREALKRLHF